MKTALELASRLCDIADAMTQNRTTQISDHTLRTLRDEVNHGRSHCGESEFVIDYQASCMIDCIAELAYARTDGDQRREERALMYSNSFRTFLRMDVDRATRQALTS